MKKNSIILAIMVLLLFAGCSGVSDYGVPTELVGTWEGKSVTDSSGTDLWSKITFDGSIDYEGTWEYSDTIYPPKEVVTVDADGVVHTEYPITDDVITTEITCVRVISFDGGFVDTKTTKYTKEKIDAIDADGDASDKKITNGRDASIAFTHTEVIETTVTVLENPDGSYTEKKVVKTTTTTESGTDKTTETSTVTSYDTNITTLSFEYSLYDFNGDMNLDRLYGLYTQTKTVEPGEITYNTERSYNIVINEDGTITQTLTLTQDVNEGESTQTHTNVYSGYVIGRPETANSKGLLTINFTKAKTTATGTGDYEGEAHNFEYESTVSYVADHSYYISGDKLITSAVKIPGIIDEGAVLTRVEEEK